MKNRNLKAIMRKTVACASIGWMCWTIGNISNAQTQTANSAGLSPDLQEVVTLSQSHMGDEVILNFIKSSGKSYKLGADDIVYLNSQGVSQNVISALQNASSANLNSSVANPPVVNSPVVPPIPAQTPYAPVTPVPSAPTSFPPPAPIPVTQVIPPPPVGVPPQAGPEVNFNYFHDQLAPFGTWVNIGGVMYWHPDQAIAANPGWRPYYDMGKWVQTDNGLFWQSDYTWGDIPFHYGRWVLDPFHGWLWAPDYTWGPSWVFWRHGEMDGAIGWAPLPVGAVFVDGEFMYRGVRVGVDFDFGLGESCFVFVGQDHFHEGFFRMRGHEWGYHIGHERLHAFYGRSVIRNEFRRDEHGRFVNNGIGRERMERVTHLEHSRFEERRPVGDRNQLAKDRMEHPVPGNGSHTTLAHSNPETSVPQHGAAAQPAVSKVFRPPTPVTSSSSTSKPVTSSSTTSKPVTSSSTTMKPAAAAPSTTTKKKQ